MVPPSFLAPFTPVPLRQDWSRKIGEELTGFPHQQEEPDTARQIDGQRDRVRRRPQQIQCGPDEVGNLGLNPVRTGWVGGGSGVGGEIDGGAADEGGCQAPGHADQEEAKSGAEQGGRGFHVFFWILDFGFVILDRIR